MRKLICIGCIALAAGVGLTIGALEGSLGLGILLGAKLMILGSVIGAFLSNIGRKSSKVDAVEEDAIEADKELERVARMGSHDSSPEELMANYWRDKGHPPFMNPEDYDPKS